HLPPAKWRRQENCQSSKIPSHVRRGRETPMFEWYRSLTPEKRRTFWACYGGFCLDGLAVMLFSFVIPTLTILWSMSKAQAGAIATVTLVLSAFGGWIAGILADR